MSAHDLLVYLRVSTFCVRTWSRCIVQDVLACVIPPSIGMRCLLSVRVHRHMCDPVRLSIHHRALQLYNMTSNGSDDT